MSSEDQHEYNAIRALIAALDVRVVALEELVQPLGSFILGSSPDGEDGSTAEVDGQAEVPGPTPDAAPADEPTEPDVVASVSPLSLGRAGFDSLINSED